MNIKKIMGIITTLALTGTIFAGCSNSADSGNTATGDSDTVTLTV